MNKYVPQQLALAMALTVPALAWASGGHFRVDDAAITPSNTCEMELWATRTSPVTEATFRPGCNLTGRSQWSVPIAYNLRDDEFSLLGFEHKSMLLNQRRGPLIAWAAGVNYNLQTDRFSDVYLNLPISFQLAESVVMHLNAGALYDRFERETYATWGAATNIKVADGPTLIAEIAGDNERDPVIGAGLRFHVGSTSWTMDLGMSRDTGPGKNSYTLGLNIPSLF